MFEQWQTWWQNSGLETQTTIREGVVLVLALLAGHLLARAVAGYLRAHNFDAALRLPGSSAPSSESHHFTPTFFAGMLVRLSIWGWAACWLARQHDRAELAESLRLIINRTWGLASLLVAAVAIGTLLARRLLECMESPTKSSVAAANGRQGSSGPQFDPARAVAVAVYVAAVLLALMMAADWFDWPLTRTSAQALWQLAQQLLVAVAALAVGLLGARWTRELTRGSTEDSLEARAGRYTAMGIMAATTLMACSVLLSGPRALVGLVVLVLLACLLWLARGYLPDVTAYLRLRSQKVRQVKLNGVPWQVTQLGWLNTRMGRAGQFCEVQNRRLLEAHLQAAAAR
jgi:hypothetical protein